MLTAPSRRSTSAASIPGTAVPVGDFRGTRLLRMPRAAFFTCPSTPYYCSAMSYFVPHAWDAGETYSAETRIFFLLEAEGRRAERRRGRTRDIQTSEHWQFHWLSILAWPG
jgi:hypothetical protein